MSLNTFEDASVDDPLGSVLSMHSSTWQSCLAKVVAHNRLMSDTDLTVAYGVLCIGTRRCSYLDEMGEWTHDEAKAGLWNKSTASARLDSLTGDIWRHTVLVAVPTPEGQHKHDSTLPRFPTINGQFSN